MRFHFQGTTSVGYFSSSNHLCLLLLFFLWLSEVGLVSLLGARRRMVVVHVLFSLTVSSKDGARCPQDPMEGTTVSLGTYSVPKSLGFWAPIRVILASCGLCLTLLNCFKKKKKDKKRGGDASVAFILENPARILLSFLIPSQNIMMFRVCGTRPNPPPQPANCTTLLYKYGQKMNNLN